MFLYRYGVLEGFVNYAILGIREFSSKNHGFDNVIV